MSNICKCATYAHNLVKVGHIIFSVYVRETYGDSALQDCVLLTDVTSIGT